MRRDDVRFWYVLLVSAQRPEVGEIEVAIGSARARGSDGMGLRGSAWPVSWASLAAA